ncbi:TNT domain-containing protein [Kitasatospora sp. KL5]|uniref:TNT domain-containing protein n=1 Tax=Kitasatospora sp. KL5 TaxID=3425125 RepID=UPI003D6E6E5A
MLPGGLLDRFGADTGRYPADGGTPHAERALPPDSPNGPGNSYHRYVVNRDFRVRAGHIAAAFARPGFGYQEWLDPALKPSDFADSETFNVANLVRHEYLRDAAPERCAAAAGNRS